MIDMEALFTALYPFVFLIGLAGYGPQLYRLMTDKSGAEGMSVPTWVIWCAAWCISFGYGISVLRDDMFMLVAGMNMIGHFMVIGLILYRRRMARATEVLVPLSARS